MKRAIFTVCLCAAILICTSCIIISGDGNDDIFKTFKNYLQGTWEWEDGKDETYRKTILKIDRNMITINGTNIHEPMNGFTRESDLSAYSEETESISITTKTGKIYIKDKGEWQNPVQYKYWETASSQKRLTLEEGTSKELTLFYK